MGGIETRSEVCAHTQSFGLNVNRHVHVLCSAMQLFSFFALHPCACIHYSPSGKPLGLQACMHTVEGAKREQLLTTKERGEHSRYRRPLKKSINSYSPSKVANEWRSIPLFHNIVDRAGAAALSFFDVLMA